MHLGKAKERDPQPKPLVQVAVTDDQKVYWRYAIAPDIMPSAWRATLNPTPDTSAVFAEWEPWLTKCQLPTTSTNGALQCVWEVAPLLFPEKCRYPRCRSMVQGMDTAYNCWNIRNGHLDDTCTRTATKCTASHPARRFPIRPATSVVSGHLAWGTYKCSESAPRDTKGETKATEAQATGCLPLLLSVGSC